MKTYLVWMTSWQGTYTAGRYKAKSAAGATSKARREHGPGWTYYVPQSDDLRK